MSGTYSFVYFITIIFLLINSVNSYNEISYNETEPGYKIHQILPFRNDGTIIVHMVKPINETCVEPRIDLRIIHPNNTVELATIDYPIPDYNFCFGPTQFYYWFELYRSLPNSLIVLYINSTDLATASYYALLTTRTGKVISNTYIAPVSVINGSLYANGYLVPHINDEYGFMFLNYETETVMMWSYFDRPDNEGKINRVSSGKHYLQSPFDDYFLSPVYDGPSYCFVTLNSTDSKINAVNSTGTTIQSKKSRKSNPSRPISKVFATFIKPTTNTISGPYLIYQSAIPNIIVNYVCDTSMTSMGNSCILTLRKMKGKKVVKNYVIGTLFRNTGAIISTKKLTNIDINGKEFFNIRFNYLWYGGCLVLSTKKIGDTGFYTIQGTILDENGDYYGTWGFPQNLTVSSAFSLTSFKNGTLVLATHENDYNWKVLSTPMPKFIPNDVGYNNPHIKFTYPQINSTISPSTTYINITYNSPIAISENNISIYQYNDGNPILRQTLSGNSQFISTSPDNMIVNIEVLRSTFNKPNSMYYIVVSDNSVKDLKSDQPLMGIERNTWKFNTTDFQDMFADSTTGQFSLTTEGTKYFESLSSYDQGEFLSQLRNDLSGLIPVDINRLGDIKCCEYDKSQNPPKILLSLRVKSTIISNERNVENIMKDLDVMIKEKEVTLISWLNTTNYLDANFGFQGTRNLLDYKFQLIGVAIGIIIIGLLFLYARKKFPEGRNVVIIKFFLSIFGVILSVTFILFNGRNVMQLYIPSIIFCITSISINFLMSMIIILQEIKTNKYFYEWFKTNINTAALFTVLASADLEMLNILNSRVAGITLFNAPISEKTQSYIFWGSIIGFFIGDIPRSIIQVFYKLLIVNYDIIPFLALSTSSIILANNIVSKIYKAIIDLRAKRSKSDLISNIEKNGNNLNVEKNENNLTVPKSAKMYYRHSA